MLAQSAAAFSVVKCVGAAYLVYLGVRLLVSKSSPAQGKVVASSARLALLEGILVEALNVKTALFFLAFLPQFLASGGPVVLQLVIMGTTCMALNTLVDVGAAIGITRLPGSEFSARWRAQLLNTISGVPLVGLGLYVAASKRGA